MKLNKFFPILNWLPLVKQTWKNDLIAGLTVTVIAIPQAVAFAFIAGLPPVYGLYAAIIIPLVTAIFGSSNHLISGPTTSVSILIFASVTKLIDVDPSALNYTEVFISLAVVMSFMAGFIQLLMGFLKMAKFVNFVSHSVIIGFTAGAGILIAFKQLGFVFGLDIPRGSSFLDINHYIYTHISETNWSVFIVAISTLLMAILIKNIKPISKFYMLLAIIFSGFLAYFLGGESVGITTVGKIPSSLPSFKMPSFDFETIKLFASSALVLALLGAVEAVAIAKSVSLTTNQKINANQEFIAQGFANMFSSVFSGYVGSGSFTRTGVNVQAGAKTPMASVFSSLSLILIVLFGAGFAQYLPLAAMGGIILLVGYRLIDFKHIKRIFKSSNKEAVVFLATFLGTLFLNLEIALLIGIVISLLFYLQKTSNVNINVLGMSEKKRFVNTTRPVNSKICPQLEIVRIDGSIYFGTIERLRNYFSEIYMNGNKYVLIVAPGINFIDLSGAEWLSYEMKRFEENGGKVVIVGAKLVSQKILKQGGFINENNKANFFDKKNEAIAYIYSFLDKKICENCTVKVFKECKN